MEVCQVYGLSTQEYKPVKKLQSTHRFHNLNIFQLLFCTRHTNSYKSLTRLSCFAHKTFRISTIQFYFIIRILGLCPHLVSFSIPFLVLFFSYYYHLQFQPSFAPTPPLYLRFHSAFRVFLFPTLLSSPNLLLPSSPLSPLSFPDPRSFLISFIVCLAT